MVRAMTVLIGTSGWQYDHWRGHLYPRSLPKARWLEHYADRFATVEVNNAFYRLPEPGTFEAWRDRTPPDFVMAVKTSRYLTHVRRLHDPEEPARRLLERARLLGGKLGPFLVQLPSNFRRDLVLLDEALLQFVPETRVAFEPRHDSWFTEETAELLARRDVAWVLTDGLGLRAPRWRTASWGYARLHQGRASPPPCYGRRALHSWAERLAAMWSPGEEVFVYFNNDGCGCAVHDARALARAAARAGLVPTRVPRAAEATLCT